MYVSIRINHDRDHLTMAYAFIIRIKYDCGKMTMALVVSISVGHNRSKFTTTMVKKIFFFFSFLFLLLLGTTTIIISLQAWWIFHSFVMQMAFVRLLEDHFFHLYLREVFFFLFSFIFLVSC